MWIDLSELEASTPEDAPQTAHEEDDIDVAVAVRKYLSSNRFTSSRPLSKSRKKGNPHIGIQVL
jgi:hypothetical protein